MLLTVDATYANSAGGGHEAIVLVVICLFTITPSELAFLEEKHSLGGRFIEVLKMSYYFCIGKTIEVILSSILRTFSS